VSDILQSLQQLLEVLAKLGGELAQFVLGWALLLFWLAWWLWGVNWQKVWPVLARGAWLPALLVIVAAALAWSQIYPSESTCLGIVTVPNFWWQLGDVGLLAALTLLCGWLQGVFGWTPAEISLEPPPSAAHEHH
jgi:hypothetical protein